MHATVRAAHPDNYGIISLLASFMLQSAIFTPPSILPDLRIAMAQLSFGLVTKEHGMFFLFHMIPERTRPLDNIYLKDGHDLIQSLGGPLKHRVTLANVRDELQVPVTTLEFPLGRKPLLKDLDRVLDGSPGEIVLPFSMDAQMESLHEAAQEDPKSLEAFAIEAFCRFTFSIWTVLRDVWIDFESISNEALDPRTLENAMKMWSISFLSRAIPALKCKVSKDHTLRGAFRGRRSRTFREIGSHVFPSKESDLSLNDTWMLFAERPGYLHYYWTVFNRLESAADAEEQQERLSELIKSIFIRLQALPSFSLQSSPWKITNEPRVVLVINSRVLMIEAIGTASDVNRKKPRPRTEESVSSIHKALLQRYTNYTPRQIDTGITAYTQMKKRGPKNKNTRKPPMPTVVRNRPPSLSPVMDYEEESSAMNAVQESTPSTSPAPELSVMNFEEIIEENIRLSEEEESGEETDRSFGSLFTESSADESDVE